MRVTEPSSVLGLVATAEARLRRAGLPPHEATSDAEVLARHALGWNRASFLTRRRSAAPDGFSDRYETMVTRRARREPVSLITNRREFWGLDFIVTTDVLTPRPETELLVEEALALLSADGGRESDRPRSVADVGTGSGCIAVALAHELKGTSTPFEITAVDRSAAALTVATRNAVRHGVGDHIQWRHDTSLSGAVGDDAVGFDLIVANLPYIPDADMPRLPREVREFEPHTALAGGSDGLDVIRALLDQIAARPSLLAPAGHVLLEIGVSQADGVRSHLSSTRHLSITKIRDDLQGIPRVVVMRRGSSS